MPVLFNFDEVEEIPMGEGVARRPLITPKRVGNDCIVLDRWTMDAGAQTSIEVAEGDLAWFQLLDGAAVLDGSAGRHELDTGHVVFLPPGFSGALTAANGAAVLYAGVPDAKRFDAGFEPSSLKFRCVDWRVEPVLDSEHDARDPREQIANGGVLPAGPRLEHPGDGCIRIPAVALRGASRV